MSWKDKIKTAVCAMAPFALAASFGLAACDVPPNKDVTAVVDLQAKRVGIYNKGELTRVMFEGREKGGVMEGKAYRPNTDPVFEGAEKGPYETIYVGEQIRCNLKANNCAVYDGANAAAPYLVTGNVTFGRVDLSTLPFMKELNEHARTGDMDASTRALRGEAPSAPSSGPQL